MIIPTVRPEFPEFDLIKVKFERCLYNGQVTNNGEYVRRFEDKLTEYLGVPTLCFNNGQTALLTMLMAAGIRKNDGVIVPSFTFCGTVAAIQMLGAAPIFCDISSATLTLDPAKVSSTLSGLVCQPKAILAVDVYGICSDYPALEKIAIRHECKLLVDSAPAFGALFGAFPTGRHGNAQIFSFHATKPFSTMEGGCLCSRDDKLLARAKAIRDFGQDEDRNCTEVGLNGKMLEICALIGLENLKGWSQRRHLRTLKAGIYRHRLLQVGDIGVIHEPGDPAQWPNWTYFPILIEPSFGKSRDTVLHRLQEYRVMARKYYAPPLHETQPYRMQQQLPVTEDISRKIIALPMFTDMLEAEMDYVVSTLRQIKKE